MAVFAAPASAHFFTDEAIESIAPVVVFHGGERYHPTSGEEFIDHSGLAWSHDGHCRPEYHRKRFRDGAETPWSEEEIRMLGDGRFAQQLRAPRSDGPGSCRLLAGAENLFTTTQLTRPHTGGRSGLLGKAEGWYLDRSNSDRAGLPDTVKGNNRYETSAPTYFDDGLLYRNGSPTGSAFVTFWFFYDYDDGPFQSHEGDWENISIRLEPIGASEWRPVQVFYAKHNNKPILVLNHPDVVSWDHALRVSSPSGARLRVYSAKGTHASYGNGVAPWEYADRIDRDGPAWETWKQLDTSGARAGPSTAGRGEWSARSPIRPVPWAQAARTPPTIPSRPVVQPPGEPRSRPNLTWPRKTRSRSAADLQRRRTGGLARAH